MAKAQEEIFIITLTDAELSCFTVEEQIRLRMINSKIIKQK